MTSAKTQERLFRVVVRRLHWLSRVPLAPEMFDAFLLAWTAVFHRQTLRAIETLESEILRIPGIAPVTHRFGGLGFTSKGSEFAHVHGNGLLDVKMSRERAAALIAEGRALPHHMFGPSAWISFWIRTPDDSGRAVALIQESLTLSR